MGLGRHSDVVEPRVLQQLAELSLGDHPAPDEGLVQLHAGHRPVDGIRPVRRGLVRIRDLRNDDGARRVPGEQLERVGAEAPDPHVARVVAELLDERIVGRAGVARIGDRAEQPLLSPIAVNQAA